MRRLLVLSLSAPLLLIGAAHPDRAGDGVHRDHHASPSADYRPCRPGPGDDRCIQLYERGVRASYADWRERRGAPGTQVATAHADDHAGHRHHRRAVRVAMHEPDHRTRHRIRRAGERG